MLANLGSISVYSQDGSQEKDAIDVVNNHPRQRK